MRYVSYYDLTLWSKGGKPLYKFVNGELNLGAGVTIDAAVKTPDENTLQRVYPVDLAGKKEEDSGVSLVELCGQGDLTQGLDADGGHRLFYEADPVSVANIAIRGMWYEVTAGSVIHNGKTYHVGGTFFLLAGDTIADAGTGAMVQLLLKPPFYSCVDLTAEFKTKHLEFGDEPKDYYSYSIPAGFEPRNSLLSEEIGVSGFGYMRTNA